MQLVPTRQTLKLTGLSPAKLREWTSRRALIPADVPPKKQGSSSLYTWQTILILRLAVTLQEKFCLELQAHRALFSGLRENLRGHSFIALWDHVLALRSGTDWALFNAAANTPLDADAIILRLNPHLEVLAAGFALPHPYRTAGQLELFPVAAVDSRQGAAAPSEAPVEAAAPHRRRLA
jgi:hypothetical protein